MKVVLFYHSLVSDWNHGNAHFLRGVITELQRQGHSVDLYEPRDAWSVANLVEHHGREPLREFFEAYPHLKTNRYSQDDLDLDRALDSADLVIVHEWNDHDLVARIGRHRRLQTGYRLLFHDTHHRSVTQPASMQQYDLKDYDGVLAFGGVIRDIYLQKGWTQRAWIWHEAADTRLFRPVNGLEKEGDLVWIGNWGDEERTAELEEFLFDPVRELKLKARVHGVRYPQHARKMLDRASIDYAGWLPNYKVPLAFSHFRVTVHVPRRPYVEALPGIPTIRPFEAMAAGIPLVCSPWDDAEKLFTAGKDYLTAADGREMRECLHTVLHDPELAGSLAKHARQTILNRHTCAHRVDELLGICRELGVDTAPCLPRHRITDPPSAEPWLYQTGVGCDSALGA